MSVIKAYKKEYLKENIRRPQGKSDRWCICCDKYIYRNKPYNVLEFQFPNKHLIYIYLHEDCSENFIKELK